MISSRWLIVAALVGYSIGATIGLCLARWLVESARRAERSRRLREIAADVESRRVERVWPHVGLRNPQSEPEERARILRDVSSGLP